MAERTRTPEGVRILTRTSGVKITPPLSAGLRMSTHQTTARAPRRAVSRMPDPLGGRL